MKNYEEMAESVFQRSREIIIRRAKKRKKIIRVTSSILCSCLVVLLGVGVLQNDMLTTHGNTSGGDRTENPIEESGPVNYSDLIGNKDTFTNPFNEELFSQFPAYSADIAAFDESLLYDCTAILEGKITDMYLKEYAFTVANDKFGEGGVLNSGRSTIVYELSIEKVWYGDMKIGQTVVLEDQYFFPDEIFSMKSGKSYVIPIYDVGNKISTFSTEVVSGDIERESIFSTVYPYHPQIEVTDSGYAVTTDWKTLTAREKRNIIMDVELGEYASFYKDKMVLVPEDIFSAQMGILIKNIKG